MDKETTLRSKRLKKNLFLKTKYISTYLCFNQYLLNESMNIESVLIKKPVTWQYNILRTVNYFKTCVCKNNIKADYIPKFVSI